jgi:Tfp pilus assembly protein PilO
MNDPRKVNILGHILLLLLVAAFAAMTSRHVVRPFLASQKNIMQFRKAVSTLSEADCSLNRLDQEIKRIESEIAAGEALLPADINLDVFLDQVGGLAASKGIHLEHLAPSQIRSHRLFRELVLEVHVRGSFLSITDFMAELESGQRLARINEITLVPYRDSQDCSARMSLTLYFAPEVGA